MLLAIVVLVSVAASSELPRGRCIWADGVPPELSTWLSWCGSNAETAQAADEAFDRHAHMHGWIGPVDRVDLVPSDRSASCPSTVLDELVLAERWCDDVGSAMPRRKLALCLERNGRTSEALAVLDQALANLARASFAPPSIRIGFQNDVSDISSTAARLAAKHELWDRALAYSREWRPAPMMCSLGTDLEVAEIERFRTRCEIGLGHTDEARRRCVEALDRSGESFNEVAWLWLLSYRQEGDWMAPDDALAELGGISGRVNAAFLSRLADCWRASLTEPRERIATPQMLLDAPEHFQRELLHGADDDTMRRFVSPLLDDDVTDIDTSLAWVLQQSGHPIVGPAIERALSQRKKKRDRESLQFGLENWQRRKAWLDDLSQP